MFTFPDTTRIGTALSLLVMPAGMAVCSTLIAGTEGHDRNPGSVLYETATVRARPVAGATASVSVMSREEIAALGVSSAAELIRFIPGLDLVSNGPRGGLAWVQVRGGDPNFTAVLIDGVPLNDPTDQLGGVVNLNSLSTMHVERIEIVRGPLSFFHGASGLAGAINIITRRGDGEAGGPAFEIGGGDASFLQGAASYSGSTDNRSFYVGASWEEEEDRVAVDAFERLTLRGTLQLGPQARPGLRLTGRASAWEGTDYPDASGGPVLGDGQNRISEHDEYSLGLDWNVGGDERPHRLRVGLYRHDLDRVSPAVVPNIPSAVEQTSFSTIEAGWSYALISNDSRRVNIGAAVDHERGENDSRLDFGPFQVDGTYRIDRTTQSAFVEFSETRGPLDIDLGLRIDAPEDFDAEFNPRLGLAYRFANETTRLRFSASRSYKLPSFFALASPAALGGNPALVPEIAWGGDLGLEQSFASGDLRGSLTLFYYRFEDLIDFDFDTFMNVNRSEVESRGAELSLRWDAGDAVIVQVGATRQDVEILNSDIELRHRPKWIGSARLSFKATDRLLLELDGQSVAKRFDQQIPVPTRFEVDGYELFGASATYTVQPGWEIYARVDSLLDEDYETFIGFPGPGRSFRVGVRYTGR